jgi:hypothetical protein
MGPGFSLLSNLCLSAASSPIHSPPPSHLSQPDFNVPTGGGYKKFDSFFYVRPNARELICCLLHDPRVEVAIYTSIMEKVCVALVLARLPATRT